MSRKYPYSAAPARGHQARVAARRYDAWAATHPEEANVRLRRALGMSKEKIALLEKMGAQSQGASPSPGANNNIKPSSPGSNVASAVKAGVLFAGTLSVAKKLRTVSQGKKDLDTDVIEIAKDTLAAGVSSAAITCVAKGVEFVAKNAGVARLAKGSAPLAVASSLFEMGVDLYRGELTLSSAACTLAGTGGSLVAANGGLVLGVALAPATGGASVVVCPLIAGAGGGELCRRGMKALTSWLGN